MEEWSVDDYRKIDKLLKETKEWLHQLDSRKRLNVVREILKNPHYDESDVYILCLNEYQTPSDHKLIHNPPEPRNPSKIRFRMREQKPIKPITEEKNMVTKPEKRMGRKGPRDEDWSGGEEETGREKKKRVDKKKKMVNPVVLPEKQRDLPAELKDRIRALNGSDVIMVIEKTLYETDVNTGNGRLSLPARQIDMRFLTEEEKVFLATKQDGSKVTRIRSRIIGEGGMEQGICLCKWNMPKSLSENVSVIYNLLSGWNDVLKAHELRNDKLCRHTTVQLWSFRVEGNLWFAFVKVSKSPDCNCKRYA
ncbi:putative B3 domain-containing protein At3g24850 [Rhododendron vialii]|uniref:putative B3 domain-containing protein At3g24850 n=1 Tax=Rhododendron vialii TaxID=182163 RepID=UPI00265D75C3|nr:putative B3 domain-containing protein At3g24850 [Rhododendron vialii]